MKQFDPTERIGVAFAQLICAKQLGWVFRETSTSDLGIDTQIELIDDSGATGKIIGVQVKTGESHIYKAARGLVYYGSHADLNYWIKYSLPVIMIFHNHNDEVTRWVSINDSSIVRTERGWCVTIPESNIFGLSTKAELVKLFPPSPNHLLLTHSYHVDPKHIDAQNVLDFADEVSGYLMLELWDSWIQWAVSRDVVLLRKDFVDGVKAARVAAQKFVYPEGWQRSMHAILNIVSRAARLIDKFVPRAEYIELQEVYAGAHEHKREDQNSNYAQDQAEHEEWLMECVRLVHELAKAANLFGDVIREDLDRNFLRMRGRFLVSDDFVDWEVETNYSEIQKARILEGEIEPVLP
ncbi:DUF4365 domain-containing protein [Pseudomonas aeruginosa]